MPHPCAFAALVLLAACGLQSGTTDDRVQDSGHLTIVEAPPYPPIERLGPEPAAQAREHRRWLLEKRVEERELALLRRIKRETMGNFGGVEWRWRDGPQNGGLGELTGIVYFLREPEQTLARYTRSPLYRAVRGDFARSDQDAVARRWAETIGEDVAFPGFSNMQVPVLDVAMPRAEFEERARREGWRLPVNLKLRFNPLAEPDLPAVPADLQPLIRAFPQQPRLSGPTPDIATFDAIVLRDGCFFIDGPDEDDPLVEFPLGIGVYRDGEGHLAFRSRYAADKRHLGRVGTRLQLGYRSQPRPAPAQLVRACRARTIVTITSADQAAGYGADRFAVEQYRRRHGLSAAEAIRRANECLLAQEQVIADNRLRGGRRHATLCARLGLMGNPVTPPPPTPAPPPPAGPRSNPSADAGDMPAPPPKLLSPRRNGVCRFEERDPAQRPKELIRTNRGSNMIFWADEGAVLWDHPNGFTDEGMVIPGKRIVAAREGMKDLWISPAWDGDIMLYSGPDRFECVPRGQE
jgi:hypothetical protein